MFVVWVLLIILRLPVYLLNSVFQEYQITQKLYIFCVKPSSSNSFKINLYYNGACQHVVNFSDGFIKFEISQKLEIRKTEKIHLKYRYYMYLIYK